MSTAQDRPEGETDGESRNADEGQVSEVDSLGDPGEPIYPDQSVAGMPDGESGTPDEGPQGPNAVPEHEDEPAESGPLAD